MSQTENSEANSERIRKIYAKDAKVGEVIHTVFRAISKEKHQSRGGKPYLSLLLVDRTGEIDGRVFDNVNNADTAFSNEDYLLVKGKVGTFHGKTQLVIDQLERLDPAPIDAAEFAWVPAPVAATPAAPAARAEKEHQELKVRLSKRLERLLQNPQLAQALDTFVAHLEKAVLADHGHAPPPKPERERHDKAERPPRPPRPPRESKPKVEHKSGPPEPKRDPSLPEGLAFKPFTALVPGDEKPAEPAPAAAPPAETPNP